MSKYTSEDLLKELAECIDQVYNDEHDADFHAGFSKGELRIKVKRDGFEIGYFAVSAVER